MVEEEKFRDLESKIPMLLDYIDGKLDEEATLEIRNELREDENLRRDMYFLIEADSDKISRRDCPSIDLLSSYYFGTVAFNERITQHLENHIDNCGTCREQLERLGEFDRATEKKREKLLATTQTVKSFSEFLKGIGRTYLGEELANSLVERLGEFTGESFEGKLEPAALGFSEDHSLTREEQEYLKIIQDLYPSKDELNSLLKRGDKEELEEKLKSLIEERETAEEIIEKIS